MNPPPTGICINLMNHPFPLECTDLAFSLPRRLAQGEPQFATATQELPDRQRRGEDSLEGVPGFDEQTPAAFFLTTRIPRGKVPGIVPGVFR